MPNRDMSVPVSQGVCDNKTGEALCRASGLQYFTVSAAAISSGGECQHCAGKCKQPRIWNHKIHALNLKSFQLLHRIGLRTM